MRAAQIRVTLRHSDAVEVIACCRDDGAEVGFGEWGRLVQKAHRAWNVRRPVFLYIDYPDGPASPMKISITNRDDYYIWSSRRREKNPELTVFEGSTDEGAAPMVQSVLTNHGWVPPKPPTRDLDRILADVDAMQCSKAVMPSSSRVPFRSAARAQAVATLQEAVARGDFGPTFTTPERRNPPTATQRASDNERHREGLIKRLGFSPS
jgi:hypothetical protein